MLFIISCTNRENNKPLRESATGKNQQLDSVFQAIKDDDGEKRLIDTIKTKDLTQGFNTRAVNLSNKALELYSYVSGESITAQDSLNLELALDLLDKAIKLDTQYYLAYANKAMVLSKLKKYDEAIEILDRIIKIRPDYAEGIANQGFLYEKIGNIQKATEKYKDAIAAYLRRLNNPYIIKKRVNIQVDIAFMLLLTEGKETAMQVIDTIIAINPDSKIAKYMKGTIMSFNREEFIKNF
jgi:tetratricopeptide (TPR) repeat protein